MRETPQRFAPGQARERAPLSDLFPRDEFYLNSALQ